MDRVSHLATWTTAAPPLAGMALTVILSHAALLQPAQAQPVPPNLEWETYRATLDGERGNPTGKCTIELYVAGTTEIEVQGTNARIRTLDGDRARWQDMLCTARMPKAPDGFQFKIAQGRGKSKLIETPAKNDGTAVIEVKDPKDGADLYRLDLTWKQVPDSAANSVAPLQDPVQFHGKGDGYLRTFGSPDDLLNEGDVAIATDGRVRVSFKNQLGEPIVFQGKLTAHEKQKLTAQVSGDGLAGSMEIQVDRENKVESVTMSGAGPARFDLRFHSKSK